MTVPDRAVIAAGNAMRRLWIERGLPLAALGDPMDWAQAALGAAAPLIAAAERERIRQLLLGCCQCGRIHEPHPAISRGGGKPFEYQSWAAPDGHAYQTPRLGHAAVAELLDDSAPAIPAEGTTS